MRVYMRIETDLGPRTIVMSGVPLENAQMMGASFNHSEKFPPFLIKEDEPTKSYLQWRSQ